MVVAFAAILHIIPLIIYSFKQLSLGVIFMLIKPFAPTHYLDALRKLSDRLSATHPLKQELERQWRSIEAGDLGEKIIVDTLGQLHPSEKYYVFHNLSLVLESKIQIDILLLTANFAVVFEVKNIKGTIELRQNPRQLVRHLSTGETHAFPSPEPQLEEYIHQLKVYFLHNHINLPIYGAVVFPFSSSYIERTSSATTLLLKNDIKPYVRNLPLQKEPLSPRQLEKLVYSLSKQHTDYNPYPLLKRYNLSRKDVLNGVACPNCRKLYMRRINMHWYCTYCHHTSRDAHVQAIYDYFALIDSSISSLECYQFLGLANSRQAYRLLSQMKLQKIGKYKDARYIPTYQ